MCEASLGALVVAGTPARASDAHRRSLLVSRRLSGRVEAQGGLAAPPSTRRLQRRLRCRARCVDPLPPCHFVAICCRLLAYLSSLLFPPACILLFACHIEGAAHSGKTGDAATQWWPETEPIVVAFSVRAMSCVLARARACNRPVLRPRAP